MEEKYEEHGEYRKGIFAEECNLCGKKSNDVFLIYDCRYFRCSFSPDAVCKNCCLNTQVYMHLCSCYHHSTRHSFHNLASIFNELKKSLFFIKN